MVWETTTQMQKIKNQMAGAFLISTVIGCAHAGVPYSEQFASVRTKTPIRDVKASPGPRHYRMTLNDAWATVNYAESVDEYLDVSNVLLTPGIIIDKAKKTLGFSVKDLAKIFNVQRQTLYNHMKGHDSNMPEKQWKRFKDVNAVVDKLSPVLKTPPGVSAKQFIFEGESLFDLLSKVDLDTLLILQVSKNISDELSDRSLAVNNSGVSELDQLKTINQLTKM
jgi:hypothetical protein